MNTQAPNITTDLLRIQPQTEVVDLSDGDSNKVFLLDQKYICKQYFSPKQLRYEASGCILFNLLSSYGVPLILDKNIDSIVFEYIQSDSCFTLHQNQQLTKDGAAKKAAAFVAEVYWQYRFFNRNKLKLFPGVSWEERRTDILRQSRANLPSLKQILGQQEIELTRAAVQNLKSLAVSPAHLTLLHRDLHLDNILVAKNGQGRDRNYFIDFEHCMEGPIEFELQNSIFWQDDWSLPISLTRSELVETHKIPYSTKLEEKLLPLYYLDQLNLALARGEKLKVKKLASIFLRRRREKPHPLFF